MPGGAHAVDPPGSFNGKARDELFAREVFDSIMEARLLYNDWRDTCNRRRPHSSLK
jgi:putative transposase